MNDQPDGATKSAEVQARSVTPPVIEVVRIDGQGGRVIMPIPSINNLCLHPVRSEVPRVLVRQFGNHRLRFYEQTRDRCRSSTRILSAVVTKYGEM